MRCACHFSTVSERALTGLTPRETKLVMSCINLTNFVSLTPPVLVGAMRNVAGDTNLVSLAPSYYSSFVTLDTVNWGCLRLHQIW